MATSQNVSAQRVSDAALSFDPVGVEGAVSSVSGASIVIDDCLGALEMNARVEIETSSGRLLAEIAGFRDGAAFALPFGGVEGVRRGARVKFLKGGLASGAGIWPSPAWLGRVIDGLGRPIDGKGPLVDGPTIQPLRAAPPPAPLRARLGGRVDFGVKALNAFTPARRGQRLGIFSGSGVGKSALLGMIARNTDCDICVIALIGERGREVRDFIEDHLGPDGLARAVVVVATSDEPAMMRREAGFLALSVAEHFRDQGSHVLCLMDSLTRIAMAQREIGLAAGEPPAAKGYTPSVFSTLPALVERAGPGLEGRGAGHITGVFTVLVEGDDHDEPVADAARAILDGHIVLDRRIAERGRFPAVDILKSVSRAMPDAVSKAEAMLIAEAKTSAAAYEDMRELIRIGAYRNGANEEVDRAIEMHPKLEKFLSQHLKDHISSDDTFEALRSAMTQTAMTQENEA